MFSLKWQKEKDAYFTIPMVDYKSRELLRVNYVLSFYEQKQLAHKLKNEGIMAPYDALLSSLAFYHALASR